MKYILYIAMSLLLPVAGYAQTGNADFAQLVEAEMKSAYATVNFTANIHTANYDVVYQKLDLTVNPAVYFVSGSVTTRYVAKQAMSALTFDLSDNLTVSSVTRNGVALGFVQNGTNELVITLPAVQQAGVQDTVVVTYSGSPSTSEGAFEISTHNGSPVLWTLSEPYGAKDWWPCKQDLNDKIDSIDVSITAPSAYISVANGLQTGQVVNNNGTKTTNFKHNYPIPAYLVAIAVSNYTIYNQTAGTAPNTFPIVNYIYPETAPSVQSQLAQTVPIMNLYEQLFETYPFHAEKYGHAQCGISGGMEHTTVSFMGSFGRELIAHELAHQWFGDKVTCASWKDIWLNEGFATYLSGLVVENLDGAASFTSWKAARIQSITSAPNGAVYLSNADTLNVNRIFSDRLSYNKGAMVAHMLRFKMGDAKFFQGMKNYLADPGLAFDYAKTSDLEAHLEAASGMDLTEFFNDWVYRQGYPSYTITAQNAGTGQVKITINQTQSHASVTYFEMPVPIRLTGSGGATQNILLDNTFNGQQFTVAVPFTVTGVVFDPQRNIISRNNTATLGTSDPKLLTALKLYPNPAEDVLTLEVPQGVAIQKAIFHDALGRKVKESGSETTWDISGLASGIHFITVVTDNGQAQLEFIKK